MKGKEDFMNVTYKRLVLWILPAVVCILLLGFGDKAYGAEQDSEARGVVADAAVTDGDYIVSDEPAEPEDAEDEDSGKKYVYGVHGGPGVVAEDESEEGSSEDTAGDDGIFYIDGAAYKKEELIGNFKLTGYCGCDACGGGKSTYSGTVPTAKHTIAADLSLLPIGTKVVLEGTSGPTVHNFDGIYDVEDKGSGVNGNHIDIYFDNHADALSVTDPGWQYADVWIAVPVEE